MSIIGSVLKSVLDIFQYKKNLYYFMFISYLFLQSEYMITGLKYKIKISLIA
jgi:hypothetical protein